MQGIIHHLIDQLLLKAPNCTVAISIMIISQHVIKLARAQKNKEFDPGVLTVNYNGFYYITYVPYWDIR